jgi:hypothetical protein
VSELPLAVARSTMAFLRHEGKIIFDVGPFGCHMAEVGLSRDYCQVAPHVPNPTPFDSRGRPSAKTYVPYKVGLYQSGTRRVLVHQVALYSVSGEFPQPGYDVSHLCHNPQCCNPGHLWIELHTINMSRIRCPGEIHFHVEECEHDDGLCPGHVYKRVVCEHMPPCMKVTNV